MTERSPPPLWSKTFLRVDHTPAPAISLTLSGTLYFTAGDAAGFELWKSNGTSAGTVRVKDIAPGSGSSLPSRMTNVNGTVYFTAHDAVQGKSLWKSDGTAAGTVLLMPFEVEPLLETYSLMNFVMLVGFSTLLVNPDFGETSLWKSNGITTERAFQWDKTSSSAPHIVMTRNDKIYFFAAQFNGVNAVGIGWHIEWNHSCCKWSRFRLL